MTLEECKNLHKELWSKIRSYIERDILENKKVILLDLYKTRALCDMGYKFPYNKCFFCEYQKEQYKNNKIPFFCEGCIAKKRCEEDYYDLSMYINTFSKEKEKEILNCIDRIINISASLQEVSRNEEK